jgi:Right handed beta helix region
MPPHVPLRVWGFAVLGAVLAFFLGTRLTTGDLASASSSVNLIANGTFEGSSSGWAGWYATISLVAPGPDGSTSARASANSAGAPNFAAYTSPRAVQATTSGAIYRATGWVRGLASRHVCLAVREWAGTTVAGLNQSCVTATGQWQQIPAFPYTAKRSNDQIDVYVVEPTPAAGDHFDFDGIALTTAATTPAAITTPTTPTTTTTATTPTTAPPPPEPAPSPSNPRCDKTVTTTVQALVDSLAPGQTGCLVSGRTYSEDVALHKSGQAGAPIQLTSTDPSVHATLKGRLYVPDSSNWWAVHDLNIDARNASLLPSPTIAGDNTRWYDVDVTTHDQPGICFSLGSHGWGIAVNTIIEHSRIHDCGIRNNQQHGIYVLAAVGTIIRDNDIYDNGARGIQLYTDAQHSLIEHNVIDGNAEGIGIGGDTTWASSNNEIRYNVISNSFGRKNVEEYWTGSPGRGNTVHDNCLFATNTNTYYNLAGGIETSPRGFTAYANRVANPMFVDRAAKNFALQAGSPCAGDGPR